jgi:hypothetical protein
VGPTLLEDVFKAVKAALGAKAATQSLVHAIAEIGHGIYRARLLESVRSPSARRQRSEHLQKTSKKISQLADLLQITTPHIRGQLNVLLTKPAGAYFAVQAFEDAGIPIDTEVSIHTPFTREAMSREGSYRAMEAEVAGSRRSAAHNSACGVLSSVLVQLKSRIDTQIALMKSDKGGNPGEVYRRFGIWKLADTYQKHLGERPTTTIGGPFVKLCENVFPLFQIQIDDGLDQAVRRELTKWREQSTART